jgi:SPP1 gp7 family putative phage head morphogenesis protein
VRQAERDAGELTRISLGPPPPGVSAEVLFTHLPREALTEIVGATRSGPLAELLAQFGALAAHDARSSLILGIALGEHPSKVARRVRDSLGIPLHRARTIARTEQLRAYREGHRRWYEANNRVVKGWVWHSARGRNTCVACWAMHGTHHPLNEPMGTHPNCRCAMVPETRTWHELGFGSVSDANESTVAITPGADLFARLKPSEQLHILGPKAYAAYHDGAVDIGDFVHKRRSRDWGVTRSRGSLARALVRAERR